MIISKLAEALQLTSQQVQKYERRIDRIVAGRLQQIANILQVPVECFWRTRRPRAGGR